MVTEKEADRRMGTEPVGKLMMRIGLPIVFSMMLQAFYNSLSF
jgi:hypothetical protein